MDLFSAFNPWDRITTPEAVKKLLVDGGANNVEVEAENSLQKLENPEDWWKIAMGSGLRWSIKQIKSDEAQCIRESNLKWIRDRNIDTVETNNCACIINRPLASVKNPGPEKGCGKPPLLSPLGGNRQKTLIPLRPASAAA